VPEVRIAGDGASAAIFGIAGVATGHNHLELAPRALGLVRARCVRCRRHGGSPTARALPSRLVWPRSVRREIDFMESALPSIHAWLTGE
jgi:hypothetical protein